MFSVYTPVCFQVCELVSRHSRVWQLLSVSATTIERTACSTDQRPNKRTVAAWPNHKAKITPTCHGPFRYLLGNLACITVNMFYVNFANFLHNHICLITLFYSILFHSLVLCIILTHCHSKTDIISPRPFGFSRFHANSHINSTG